MKQDKTKEERLKEGVSILNQLKEANVKELSYGFQTLKKEISKWVATGESWTNTIAFPEYGRIGMVELPKYNNKAATMHFKMKSP